MLIFNEEKRNKFKNTFPYSAVIVDTKFLVIGIQRAEKLVLTF